jgi:alkylation response protein AidB-like acyl-CoA dehydrogenase
MPVYLYGTEEQKNEFLPKLASGEWIGAYCLTEPTAGSDANNGKTEAVLSEDGEHYIINGQKMWISNAGFARSFVVFAKIKENGKKDEKLTAFLLKYDPENPNGIKLGEEEHKLGIRASSTRQVFFTNTKVHKSMMLGKREEGLKIALNVLNIGRAKLSAGIVDSTRRVINESIRYASERVQFKTPIIKFGAIREKLARMATLTYLSENAMYRMAKDVDFKIEELMKEGLSEEEAEKKAFEDYAVEAAILKVFVSEASQEISDEGIQIFGGMGFSEDMPMESFWRDARITRIYEGTNEINRLVIISMLLRKAFKGQLDLLSPAKAVVKELTGIPSFDRPDMHEDLAGVKDMSGKLKKLFFMSAGAAVQKLGDKLVQNEMVVMAAADILIQIYMLESAYLATMKNIARYPDRNFDAEKAMVELGAVRAVEIAASKAKEIVANIASGDEKKVMEMGIKRYTKWVETPDVIKLRETIVERLEKEGRYSFNNY